MPSLRFSSLAGTPLTQIVDCMLEAFAGYFVPLPDDPAYWEMRFQIAGVDWSLSAGVFSGNRLIAFIINGVADQGPGLTAFNTGTGVLPAFRGQHLVDRMYAFLVPSLKAAGVERCQLEVIDQNERAIRVYERIGFRRTRRLKCYAGDLPEMDLSIKLQPIEFTELPKQDVKSDVLYSWDHQWAALTRSPRDHRGIRVLRSGQAIGYFVLREDGYLPRLEAASATDWPGVFSAIRRFIQRVKCNNVDESRRELIAYLASIEVENTVDQFEMEWEPLLA